MPPRNEAKTVPQQIADIYEQLRRIQPLQTGGGTQTTVGSSAPGANGATGATGATGAAGPAGAAGAPGAPGQVSWSRAFAVMGS